MEKHLYTAEGCSRCSIIKDFMADRKIEFIEKDIKGEGKEDFKVFYKQNRKQVRRGTNGIEFPILHTDGSVLQGISPILSRILTNGKLDQFIQPWEPETGWLGGLNIFASKLPEQEAFMEMLRFVKSKGLRIELASDGRNPTLLTNLTDEKLLDRLIFVLRGPADLYHALTGEGLSETKLAQSLSCLSRSPDYKIVLLVGIVKQDDRTFAFLTPEESADAASFVETVTGTKTHPFVIRPVKPDKESGLKPLEQTDLFKYRTRCRRFMVKSEIELEES